MQPDVSSRCAQVLSQGLEALGLGGISDVQRRKLLGYIGLLDKWNKVYNLTAVRDPLEMVTRHILDSLALLPYLKGPSVLDIGTGAGLPGIPLAIARPDVDFTLLDANAKKTRFVRQAAAELGLANIVVVQARVEKYRPGRKFATLIARAVGSVAEIVRDARHLCDGKGEFLLMKGAHPEPELAEMPVEFKVIETVKLHVPGLEAERHLVRLAPRGDRTP
ncbi:MAG: 16S rRNA (guanine(527)-N(7))-methyltransferase RsmG [Gammaproteobacteria bacterium]|nr:MAG: 16S rRNA (guanine(527)-N(7))-methyltransferase RsmG [Gammaproteobacteria bacterium]